MKAAGTLYKVQDSGRTREFCSLPPAAIGDIRPASGDVQPAIGDIQPGGVESSTYYVAYIKVYCDTNFTRSRTHNCKFFWGGAKNNLESLRLPELVQKLPLIENLQVLWATRVRGYIARLEGLGGHIWLSYCQHHILKAYI